MKSNQKPYILHVAEKIYIEVTKIKKENKGFSTTDSINSFIGSKIYKEISSGRFHDDWMKELNKKEKKVPDETMKLLKIQKEMMIKQLIEYPELYYTKSHSPLGISKRAFDHLWRVCESYELWCKETKQIDLILLDITD
ncbi:hypothetical protein OBA37_01925 [Candidatus Pelagibacter sp.]|nr:hypothetical protein [Candidatus Pelagibacter sp.]